MKLFSLVRNLFGREEETTFVHAAEMKEQSGDGIESGPTDAVPPTLPERTAQPSGTRSQASLQPAESGSVSIPLSAVINGMPQDMQAETVVGDVGDLVVSLPVEKILPQLAQGSVNISFGQLRRAAPNLFCRQRQYDETPVDLPLGEILPRLSPTLLVRREDQKAVSVPDEIVSPFADRGKGLSIATTSTRQPVRAAQPAAVTGRPGAPGDRFGMQSSPTIPGPFSHTHTVPARPRPVSPSSAPKPSTPKPSTPKRGQSHPHVEFSAPTSAPRPPVPKAVPPSPRSPLRPSQPVARQGPVGGQSRPPVPKAVPPSPAQPVAAPVAASAAQPVQTAQTDTPGTTQPTATSQPPLMVSLSSMVAAWPEALRLEVAQLDLGDATVALPFDLVETGLKRGRLAFSWKNIRSWIQPTPLPTVSAHDNAEVELPLSVVAPLFIQYQKANGTQKQKVAVDKEIPDLFFGAPESAPAPSGDLASAVTKPVDTNYYVWDDHKDVPTFGSDDQIPQQRPTATEFLRRYTTPNEIVSRAAALDGVEGALVALPDGLKVSSELPTEVNGDTLAAFLPHLFGKVTQCTQELKMGELNNLNFTVGNVPWKIFRVKSLFFAAFGKAGTPLPTPELAALAGELNNRSNS